MIQNKKIAVDNKLISDKIRIYLKICYHFDDKKD